MGDKNFQRRRLAGLITHYCDALNVEYTSPYLVMKENGEFEQFAAFLPGYGGEKGILIDVISAPDYEPSSEHVEASEGIGIPCSFVNPSSLEVDIAEFKSALEDWGVFPTTKDTHKSV